MFCFFELSVMLFTIFRFTTDHFSILKFCLHLLSTLCTACMKVSFSYSHFSIRFNWKSNKKTSLILSVYLEKLWTKCCLGSQRWSRGTCGWNNTLLLCFFDSQRLTSADVISQCVQTQNREHDSARRSEEEKRYDQIWGRKY